MLAIFDDLYKTFGGPSEVRRANRMMRFRLEMKIIFTECTNVRLRIHGNTYYATLLPTMLMRSRVLGRISQMSEMERENDL